MDIYLFSEITIKYIMYTSKEFCSMHNRNNNTN